MERILHEVEQGSPEWHELKAKFQMSASVSAVAMGLSPYQTRDALIHSLATGEVKEHSEFTENVIFARGHKVEAVIRAQVEKQIGEDLYPVVMTHGDYLASCDGLTINGSVAFECKQHNIDLFRSISNNILPDHHMPQAQHVMMVTGAQQLIFACGDGKERLATMTVEPDPHYQEGIKAAWGQVWNDVDDYSTPAATITPIAVDVEGFSLVVQAEVTGAVTASNVKEMEQTAIDFFGSVDRTLETDEDFAAAEKMVKFCKKVEEAMSENEAGVMQQTHSIAELLESLRKISGLARAERLYFDKAVKDKKANIKSELLKDIMGDLESHLSTLEISISPVKLSRANEFNARMRGLKTIKSIKNALNSHLAELIIQSNKTHERLQENLSWFHTFNFTGYEFTDLADIAEYTHEAFKGVCEQRKAEYDAKVQAEAKRKADQIQAAVVPAPTPFDAIIKSANAPQQDRAQESDRAITEMYGQMIKHVTPDMSVASAVSKIAELIVKGVIKC